MKANASHIKQIKVVSNTHWDREFRRSFEKTRRRLLTMLDVTLDILDKDPAYHSFTMDGHSIMIEDYLEMRPEKQPLVEKLVRTGRLVLGPYFTLAEEFSISHEPLIRNLIWGRKTVQKYGGKPGTVAYTPSSWGQTGQLPQICADFGLDKFMFYRGISHHESDAEFIWAAPDGTQMLGSRFALYARYNWYYQVHRAVTRHTVFDKTYEWGAYDEVPVRFSDGLAGEDLAFDCKDPVACYDKSALVKAITDMVAAEGAHFTTEVFLAMHGHDISVAHPLESRIIKDAKSLLKGKYTIEHTGLEQYWKELEKHLDKKKLPVLTGERRSHLKQGKWTFLFPATISSRTYLKQHDFSATTALVYYAEPLASLATALGDAYPRAYLDRGWRYLLSNHTHDANGGCAPDAVCQDMEYRYRKAVDIGEIVTEDAITHVATHLSPKGQKPDAMQLIVFNPLPQTRDSVAHIDLEIPRRHGAVAFSLTSKNDPAPRTQPISNEKSSSFVDNIWEVPTILNSNRIHAYVEFKNLPPLGYRVYSILPETNEPRHPETMLTGPCAMENEFLTVTVNANGTVSVLHKPTGKSYRNLNYLSDQGENGNAWKHGSPTADRVYTSLSAAADICVITDGPLVSTIRASYTLNLPVDYADGNSRNSIMRPMPVAVEYTLHKNREFLQVSLKLDNNVKDHWLRANFPTELKTDVTHADSHFDVVDRAIALPDSTGWVEKVMGTHPLRTFVDLSDGKCGFAVMPKGLYEYEAFDTAERVLALTLIRACRIKLAVSEEKQTELPDLGIQCPGERAFEYSLCFHAGTWSDAGLPARAAEPFVPVRAVMAGRGKGTLPLERSFVASANANCPVTCVKQAEDGSGIIIRCFNPLTVAAPIELTFGLPVTAAYRCGMDERVREKLPLRKNTLRYKAAPKKIITIKISV